MRRLCGESWRSYPERSAAQLADKRSTGSEVRPRATAEVSRGHSSWREVLDGEGLNVSRRVGKGNLVKEMWQKTQRRPMRRSEGRDGLHQGEARSAPDKDAVSDIAETMTESEQITPAQGPTMEAVVGRANLFAALKKVQDNNGAPGPDGITVAQMPEMLKEQWPTTRAQLLAGTYLPQPVRRVAIPKPDGGQRELGIPSVMDRLIQQAILQILQPLWDPTFSPHSYGFRPGRNAHQAVERARTLVASGLSHVVDIDIEKFFDRVNHDLLMDRIAKRIEDKRLLRLIRRYLEAGALMPDGVVAERDEGTPQGGPLSPLLANLLLDELDRELSSRGLQFARYADDCNIYVGSAKAADRVLESIAGWLKRKLKLTVNSQKSAAAVATTRKFLGFQLRQDPETGEVVRTIAPKSLARIYDKLRTMTSRNCGRKIERIVGQIAVYLRGWWGYYRHTDRYADVRALLGWLRRRLRQIHWRQWKNGHRRFQELRRLNPDRDEQWYAAGATSKHGPWRMSHTPQIDAALSVSYWRKLGLPDLDRPGWKP